MCEIRDALKAQNEINKNEIEQYVVIVEQLRSELEQGRTLQAQQDLEIEKLKAALANETTIVENEHAAKQEALQER